MANPDVSAVKPLPQPIDSIMNIASYMKEPADSAVNLPSKDAKTGADGFVVEHDKLEKLMQQNAGITNSDMIERLQNRAVFGTYIKND